MTLHVGQGTTVGAMTVFPVWNGGGGIRHYVTGTHHVSVTECDGGPSVPQLLATNAGNKDVLVLDGQLFEGGWQHRMATRSSVVPAGERVAIDVACVEQGRWHGTAGQTTRGRRASTFVRNGFDGATGGQHEVWRRVERAGGSTSATGSFVDHIDRSETQMRRLFDELKPLPGQTGVLVGVAGQPLVLEDFDHPRTLGEQFAAIIQAAGLDALGQPEVPTPGRRARRLVERYEGLRLERVVDGHGHTRLGTAHTPKLDVMALDHQRRRAHLRVTYRLNPILMGA